MNRTTQNHNQPQSPATPRQQRESPAERAASRARVYQPRIDVLERDQEFVVRADMPGLDAQQVDITCERGLLSIQGRLSPERTTQRERSSARVWLREYGLGDFRREIRLGDTIDTQRIEADYSEGVLTLRLPKLAEMRPRKVEVKGS